VGTSHYHVVHRVYFAVLAAVMATVAWLRRIIETALLLLPARSPLTGPARRDRGPQKRLNSSVSGVPIGQ
jgi:hypothetical protein